MAVVFITSEDFPPSDKSVPTVEEVITHAIDNGTEIIMMVVPSVPDLPGVRESLVGSVGSRIPSSNVVWVGGSFIEMNDHVDELRQLICGGEWNSLRKSTKLLILSTLSCVAFPDFAAISGVVSSQKID